MGSRAAPGEGRVIKLSDVKVRLQYRWRVRQRLMVLHLARLQGPTAAGRRFGVSVRTIRRWRARWRLDALQGLVPRYPRRRGRRITPRVVELIGQARRELESGETVQVDVKFVKIAGRWAFQYTALDDCTRLRALRLYRRLHQSSSLAFLTELCRAFPFRIRKLQCDNVREFPFSFALAVEALG